MTASPPPATSNESLPVQLEAAATVILANGWLTKPQLEGVRTKAFETPPPKPAAGRTPLTQFLLDHHHLSREQVGDLEAILRHQASLPEFRLMRKIGAGGMGTVFLALHRASDRTIALKTINTRLAEDRDFVERFHRESRALSKVDHPNVAQIIDSGESDGHCWLAMEYIEGPSLMHLLKDHRVLPEAYSINIIKQIAQGLDHVYSAAGLVHRDIKPENILVIRSRSGDDIFPLTDIAKLIDFGLVKSDQENDRLTQTGMTIGTPLYMSPEQVRGEKLDCRSDIYGLGATLFHLLTGVTPFTGPSPGAIMSAHLTEPPPDPGNRVPSLRPATRELVMTMMAKAVDKRFLNFDALLRACNKALEGLEGPSSSMPRLLRKPMILNKPVRKTQEPTPPEAPRTVPTGRVAKSAPPPTTTPPGKIELPDLSALTASPPQQPPQPGEPLARQADTQLLPDAVAEAQQDALVLGTKATGSDVLARIHTNRITKATGGGKQPGSDQHRQVAAKVKAAVAAPAAPPMPPVPSIIQPSAAYVDPPPSSGMGTTPWIVLGGALAIVLGVVIWLYL